MGHSEVLSIEKPPGDSSEGNEASMIFPLSVFRSDRSIKSEHTAEEASECVVVGAEDSGDVFPDEDGFVQSAPSALGIHCVCDSDVFKGKVSSFVVERFAESGDGERLTRSARDKDIGCFQFVVPDSLRDGHEVADVRDIRPVMCEDG